MDEIIEQTDLEGDLQDLDLQDEKDRRLEKKHLKATLSKRWAGLSEHAANVAITRKFPAWCEGYQGSLPIELCENLDDVQKRCGGGTYILRFTDGQGEYVMQQTVIIDGDSMRNGVRLETPEEQKKRVRREEELDRMREIQALQVQQQANTGSEFVKAMEVMKQGQDESLKLIIALATRQPAAQVQGGNIKENFDLFKELHENFQPNNENNEGMWNVIEKFVDKMGDEQKAQKNAPPLLGAAYQAINPGSAPRAQAGPVELKPVPNPGPAAPGAVDPVFEAFNELSGLEGAKAWERMNTVFENLSEEKQKKLRHIFGPGDTIDDTDTDIDDDDLEADNESDGETDDENSGTTG